MSWIDFVLIVIIIAAVAIQSKRGSLQACFDFLAALLALGVAKSTCGKTEGWAPLIAFSIVFAALLVISYYLYNLTAFTLETYDSLFGGIFGFALACVIGWTIYWAGDAVRTNPLADHPDWILDSRLAVSFYDWQWWKGFLDFMSRLGETK
jgi:hypothetical protein